MGSSTKRQASSSWCQLQEPGVHVCLKAVSFVHWILLGCPKRIDLKKHVGFLELGSIFCSWPERLGSGNTVDGCESISHHFDTMVEAIV